jgi:hypothetical protein
VGTAFFPLDRELGLLAGEFTPHVQESLVLLSTVLPFAAAAKMLHTITQVRVSKSTAMRVTERAGAAYVALQEESVAALERTAAVAPPGAERMVVSADGAMVPLLHGQWGEVRTLAIGEAMGEAICLTPAQSGATPAKPRGQRNSRSQNRPEQARQPGQPGPEIRTHNISYFSRLTSAEAFTRLSLCETHERGLENSRQVAAVMDGAEWLQGFSDHHCPQAVRILDFAHAAQRIGEIGQALFGVNNQQADRQAAAWSETWRHNLKHTGPQALLAQLQQLRKMYPDNETLRSNLAYLQKRAAQMEYPHFVQQGWPIASGMIESANKLVVEARLKGSGMHWHPGHVNAMLALRNIYCNDRWEQEWPKIEARLIAQACDKRSRSCQKRLHDLRRTQQEKLLAQQRAQYLALHPEWLIEAQADTQPDLPVATPPTPPTPPIPPAKKPNKPNKPAPDHPWRRPLFHSPKSTYSPKS